MEDILLQYGAPAMYGLTILFGGVYGTKLIPGKKKFDRFFVFSAIVAVLFICIEYFVQHSFQVSESTKYLFTYTLVAVCYQRFIKSIFVKWGLVDDDPKPAPYKAPEDQEQQNT